jgi:hypothetical protein
LGFLLVIHLNTPNVSPETARQIRVIGEKYDKGIPVLEDFENEINTE